MSDRPPRYRQIIDELARQTREGQGAIAATRARSGVWNPNVTAQSAPDQHNYNILLSRLTPHDRAILAEMLAHEFVRGVHTALNTLHAAQLEPFELGYQESPAHDYMGRLNGSFRWP